ncbi:Arginine-binding extracellular protein ArtP precursor [Planococcus massiliensis]|uniref:Arginine-binding extracellular protein ArtP n=1 Tax=Planococcus massiliensis TaxID=1499687 RepID=A0A098EK05_9BACL|nr:MULTISPECIES: ABC transporter substrate-binding protein [Planococcus]MCJ1906941.1 ABC transporter substrate-binding protein [Planococcus ruber]CEG22175.1 Arginine-binding extracellular protein ArtP precursor [Planococcus massiliensis]
MKKKNVLLAIAASAALMLGACGNDDSASGSSDASDDAKVLKMGTSAEFPPFESRNVEGEIVGFDIDLANHIADELGYKLEINDMKFDGLIGALQNDRVDMVIAGMSATEQRKENVDFSTEYNHSGEMFLTPKGSDVKTLEDLEGKVVGVQLGTIQEEGANSIIKDEGINFELKSLDDSGALIQEILSGRIDAAYMDKAVAKGYIDAQDLDAFDDPTTASPGMAVAFPKGGDLVEDVNKVLAEMEESGKMDELKEKWEILE